MNGNGNGNTIRVAVRMGAHSYCDALSLQIGTHLTFPHHSLDRRNQMKQASALTALVDRWVHGQMRGSFAPEGEGYLGKCSVPRVIGLFLLINEPYCKPPAHVLITSKGCIVSWSSALRPTTTRVT
jgi:hypothetical protein